MNKDQVERAVAFGKLHHGGKTLVLLNAWDAASARVFELAGAPAVATTSSGLAASNGYPDGQKIPRERLVDAVRKITRVVKVPVTVDSEAGYGKTVAEVCAAIRAIIDAGAIGINIEDGLEPPSVLADKIKGIREFADQIGLPLFINARTDVFLRAIGEPDSRFDETMRRIAMYAAAGASGAFVPGLTDIATIGRIAKASALPLNVMFSPGQAPVPELQAQGVARVSIGGAATFAAMSLTKKIAEKLLNKGTYDTIRSSITISHAEVMKMFPSD
ncbi:MAG: isocitrate lyase/phosphoenolpyruvate mutase family protein [Candidatus Binataceae bacterium]